MDTPDRDRGAPGGAGALTLLERVQLALYSIGIAAFLVVLAFVWISQMQLQREHARIMLLTEGTLREVLKR